MKVIFIVGGGQAEGPVVMEPRSLGHEGPITRIKDKPTFSYEHRPLSDLCLSTCCVYVNADWINRLTPKEGMEEDMLEVVPGMDPVCSSRDASSGSPRHSDASAATLRRSKHDAIAARTRFPLTAGD